MNSVTENFSKNRVEVPKNVQKMYQAIQKRTGAVGGYGHNGPVYGEVTMGTFQKVVNFMRENLEFGTDSSFLDIGAGLGKPNLHVAMEPGVKMSFGVELEELRWQLSMHNLRFALDEVEGLRPSVVYFAHNDVTDIHHFEPFSHVYMFDVGFPPAALVAIANAFNVSRTVKALISFTRPLHVIKTYGFAVTCIGKIQTRMHGSSEGHTAYIYRSTHNNHLFSTTPKDIALVDDVVTEDSEEAVGPTEVSATTRSSPRKKRRVSFSPVRHRRRQQMQLDKVFFATTGKKARGAAAVAAAPEITGAKVPPSAKKTLFPDFDRKESASKRFRVDTSGPDPIVGLGMDVMSISEDYSAWVATAGRIGDPGVRPCRNAKRVLFNV